MILQNFSLYYKHLTDSLRFVKVLPLDMSDGPPILAKLLSSSGRTVTDDQKQLILDSFSRCPLPLYLRLCVDIAVRWRSFDQIKADALASDMPGMITLLFQVIIYVLIPLLSL